MRQNENTNQKNSQMFSMNGARSAMLNGTILSVPFDGRNTFFEDRVSKWAVISVLARTKKSDILIKSLGFFKNPGDPPRRPGS